MDADEVAARAAATRVDRAPATSTTLGLSDLDRLVAEVPDDNVRKYLWGFFGDKYPKGQPVTRDPDPFEMEITRWYLAFANLLSSRGTKTRVGRLGYDALVELGKAYCAADDEPRQVKIAVMEMMLEMKKFLEKVALAHEAR